LLTVGFCAVVSPLAIFAAAAFKGFGASESLIAELIPTVAWWFAFSSSLFLWDRMRNRGQLLPQ